MRCKKCGAENSEESRFCGNCGAQFETEETDSLREKPVQAKRQGRKWIWGILAVVVIAGIIAGVLILRNVQERKSYEKYLDSAEKYLEELDYENAEAAYLKAIDVEPKEEEPYVALARLYLGQGETDKAQTILEQGAQKTSGTVKSGTHKEEEESIEDLLEDVKDAAAYTWVLDPSVQADDINYVTSQDLGRASENEVKKQKNSPYAVLRTGDRYGMISQDGELLYEGTLDFDGEPGAYEPASRGSYMAFNSDPVATEDYIAVPYLDKIKGRDRGGMTEIQFWSWDCELLHRLIFDKSFTTFTIDPKSNILYACPFNDPHHLYIADLSDILAASI